MPINEETIKEHMPEIIVVGAGGVLALMFLLNRKNGASGATAPYPFAPYTVAPPTDPAHAGSAPAPLPGPDPSPTPTPIPGPIPDPTPPAPGPTPRPDPRHCPSGTHFDPLRGCVPDSGGGGSWYYLEAIHRCVQTPPPPPGTQVWYSQHGCEQGHPLGPVGGPGYGDLHTPRGGNQPQALCPQGYHFDIRQGRCVPDYSPPPHRYFGPRFTRRNIGGPGSPYPNWDPAGLRLDQMERDVIQTQAARSESSLFRYGR